MTIEEMRDELRAYCKSHKCIECPLFQFNGAIDGCCESNRDETIIRDYAIVFGFRNPTPDASAQPDNVQRHESICHELNALYARKNADYGDSFHKTYVEEGMTMARIRLSDKLERFKQLTRSNEQNVHDESVRDTLIDLANYAILTVMELDGGGSGEG